MLLLLTLQRHASLGDFYFRCLYGLLPGRGYSFYHPFPTLTKNPPVYSSHAHCLDVNENRCPLAFGLWESNQRFFLQCLSKPENRRFLKGLLMSGDFMGKTGRAGSENIQEICSS